MTTPGIPLDGAVADCKCQRHVSATSSVPAGYNITVAFTFKVSSLSITGRVWQWGAGFPTLESLAHLAPLWEGTLSGKSSTLHVTDHDLYDGVTAAVLSLPNTPASWLTVAATTMAHESGSLNRRLQGFQVAPSALEGEVSSRMAFQSFVDPSTHAFGGRLATTGSGSLVQQSSQCSGDSCASAIIDSLSLFAATSVLGSPGSANTASPCKTITAITDTIRSVTTSSAFAGEVNGTAARSAHGHSHGVFSCDLANGGGTKYITVSLGVRGGGGVGGDGDDGHTLIGDGFPAALVQSDIDAALGTIRAIPLTPTGHVRGVLGGSIGTLLPGDIFGASRAGTLVVDGVLTNQATRIGAAFNAISAAMHSGITSVDSALSAILPSDATDLINKYNTLTPAPTLLGFFAWWADQADAELTWFAGPTGDSATLHIALTVFDGPLGLNDPAISSFNALLTEASDALRTEFPAIPSKYVAPSITTTAILGKATVSGVLSGAVHLSNLLSTQPITVHPDAPPVVLALATADAIVFSATTSMFKSTSLTYDYEQQRAHMHIAAVPSDVSSIVGSDKIAMIHFNNQPSIYRDLSWIGSPFQSSASFHDAARAIELDAWASGGALEPLDLIPGALGPRESGSTLAQLMDKIGDAIIDLPKSPKMLTEMALPLEAAIRAICLDSGTIASSVHVAPLGDHIHLHLHLHTLRDVALTGGRSGPGPWASVVDMGRVPVHLASHLSLTFISNSTDQLDISFKADGFLSGWVTPVRHSMGGGCVHGGTLPTGLPSARANASIAIHLPYDGNSEGGLHVSAQGSLVAAGNVGARWFTLAIDSDLSGPSSPLTFSFTPQRDIGGATLPASAFPTPLGTIQSLTGALDVPNRIMLHMLATPLPPLVDPIDQYTKLPSAITSRVHSLRFPLPKGSRLALTTQQCSPRPSIAQHVRFVVNTGLSADVNCVFNIKPSADLHSSIQSSLMECGVGHLVTVSVDEDEDGCFNAALYPRIPGLVYALTLATRDVQLFKNQTWSRAGLPVALGLNDLGRAAHVLLSDADSPYVPPSTIDIDSALVVPSDLKRFYPATRPAVVFDVSLSTSSVHQGVKIAPKVDDASGDVTFDLGGATQTVSSDASFSMKYGLSIGSPPAANVSVMTSFSSSNPLNSTIVPQAPNNTFTIVLTAEVRQQGGALEADVMWTDTITLVPGQIISTQLLTSLIPSLHNTTERLLLSIEDAPSRSVFGETDDQLRLTAVPYVDGADRLWLPTSLTLKDSKVPGVGAPITHMTTQAPRNSRPIVKKMSFGWEGVSKISTSGSANGTMGMFSNVGGKVLGQGAISVSVNELDGWHLASQTVAATLRPSDFIRNFDGNVTIDSSYSITSLVFADVDVDLADLDKAQLQLRATGTTCPSQLASKTWPFQFSVDAPPNGPSANALPLLAHPANSLCEAATVASSTTQIQSPLASTDFPFAATSWSPLLTDAFSPLLSFTTAVCGSGTGADTAVSTAKTLGHWCKMFHSVGVCATVKLNGDGLNVQLISHPLNAGADVPFKFDTASLLKGTKNANKLPPGVGTTGDISVHAGVNISLGLVFSFKDHKLSVGLDPTDTYFKAAAGFDFIGTAKLHFGAISLTFAQAEAWVSGPGTLPGGAALLEGKLQDDHFALTLSGDAALDAVIGFPPLIQCGLSVQVTDLQKFIEGQPAVHTEAGCGDGFVDELLNAMEDSDIAHYFEQEASYFWKQWKDGIDGFRHGIVNELDDLIIGFLDKYIEKAVDGSLNELVGPAVAKEIGTEIAEMANELILHHHGPNRTEVVEVVLQLLTGILNKALAKWLVEPLVPPSATASEFVWHFHFGHTYKQPVTHIAFDAGEHGLIGLDVKCDMQLVEEWDLKFDLAFNTSTGFHLRFPIKPAFKADMKLDLPDGPCDLEGHLLLVAMDLSVDSTTTWAEIDLEVNGLPHIGINKFSIEASLGGKGDLGLAGLTKKQLHDAHDSLYALPHVQARVTADWGWVYSSGKKGDSTPNHFNITDIELCLGSLLVHLIGTAVDEVDKILKPLDPFIKVLTMPIPGLDHVFGHRVTPLTVVDFFCRMDGSCDVKEMEELLTVLADFMSVIETLENLDKILTDPEGCGDVTILIQAFELDFHHPELKGIPIGPVPPPDPHFNPNKDFPDSDKKIITDFYSKALASKWGVHLAFSAKDIPKLLVDALLGINDPLVEFTFPDASLSASLEWDILIWPWPEVEINLGLSCGLVFAPPPVAVMSQGIAQAIEQKNAALLFTGMGVSTQMADGSPRFVIVGAIQLKGGVTIGIFIFEGYAQVSLEFDAKGSIVSATGDAWVTFDDLAQQWKAHGITGTFDVELDLVGGLYLGIRACIHIPFLGKHCWTIVKWDTQKTLWSHTFKAPRCPAVGSGTGALNLDAVAYAPAIGAGGGSEFFVGRIWAGDAAGGVMMALRPSGSEIASPTLSRSAGSGHGVSSTGTAQGPFSVVVGGALGELVTFPDSQFGTLKFQQDAYPDASSFSMSSHALFAPSHRAGVSIGGACAAAMIDSPLPSRRYAFSGLPKCPVTLDTGAESSLNIDGSPADFGGQLLTVTGGVESVSSAVQATVLDISPGVLQGRMKIGSTLLLNVNMPAATVVDLSVTGHSSKPTLFTLHGVATDVSASLIGGGADDTVVIPDVRQLLGPVSISGGDGANLMVATLPPMANVQSTVAAVSPFELMWRSEDKTHRFLVRHTNVRYRHYNLLTAPKSTSVFSILPPEPMSVVNVTTVGSEGSTITTYVTGCDGQSLVRVHMTGGGDQYVVVGSMGSLLLAHCAIQIFGETPTGQINTVTIAAEKDTRRLVWEVAEGRIVVNDEDGQSLPIYFQGIHRLVLKMGPGGNDVRLDTGTVGTETVVDFGAISWVSNTLRVVSTRASVIVNGTVDSIFLGPDNGADGQHQPLGSIQGTLAIATVGSNATVNGRTTVSLACASGASAPAQHYAIDDMCVEPTDAKGVISPMASKATDWMCSLLGKNDLSCLACHMLYSTGIQFNIATGAGQDSVRAWGMRVPLTASLGDGNDHADIRVSSLEAATCSLFMGDGADVIWITGQLATVYADLGSDSEPDDLEVYYGGAGGWPVPPNVNGDYVSPIGPWTGSYLKMSNVNPADFVRVRRGLPPSTPPPLPHKEITANITASVVESTSVVVNASTPGGYLYIEMNDNTTYQVKGCAPGATVVFDAESTALGDAVVAVGTSAHVALPSVDSLCTVAVSGVVGSDGVAGFDLSPMTDSLPVLDVSVHRKPHPEYSTIDVGQVTLRAVNSDHAQITAPTQQQQPPRVYVGGGGDGGFDLAVVGSANVVLDDSAPQGGNLLISHATVEIPTKAFTLPTTTLVLVDGAASTVDASSLTAARIINQCVTLTPAPPKPAQMSQWMHSLAEKLSGDHLNKNIGDCSVVSIGADQITLDNLETVAVGGLGKHSVKSVVLTSADADVILEPARQANEPPPALWSSVHLSHSIEVATADSSFAVTLNGKATLDLPVLLPNAAVDVSGCAGKGDEPTEWVLGNLPTKPLTRMGFDGSVCKGHVALSASSDLSLAPFVTAGTGTVVTVVLALPQHKEPRNNGTVHVSLEPNALVATYGALTLAQFAWRDADVYDVHLDDSMHAVLHLHSSFNTEQRPSLWASPTAETAIVGTTATILLPDTSAVWNKKERSYHLTSTPGSTLCLDPCRVCGDDGTVAAALPGGPCRSVPDELSCQGNAGLLAHAARDVVFCGAPQWASNKACGAVTLNAVKPPESETIHPAVWVLWLVAIVVILSGVLTVIAVLGFPKPWQLFGDHFGWTRVALSLSWVGLLSGSGDVAKWGIESFTMVLQLGAVSAWWHPADPCPGHGSPALVPTLLWVYWAACFFAAARNIALGLKPHHKPKVVNERPKPRGNAYVALGPIQHSPVPWWSKISQPRAARLPALIAVLLGPYAIAHGAVSAFILTLTVIATLLPLIGWLFVVFVGRRRRRHAWQAPVKSAHDQDGLLKSIRRRSTASQGPPWGWLPPVVLGGILSAVVVGSVAAAGNGTPRGAWFTPVAIALTSVGVVVELGFVITLGWGASSFRLLTQRNHSASRSTLISAWLEGSSIVARVLSGAAGIAAVVLLAVGWGSDASGVIVALWAVFILLPVPIGLALVSVGARGRMPRAPWPRAMIVDDRDEDELPSESEETDGETSEPEVEHHTGEYQDEEEPVVAAVKEELLSDHVEMPSGDHRPKRYGSEVLVRSTGQITVSY